MPDAECETMELTRPEQMVIKAIRRTESLPTNVDYASVEAYADYGPEVCVDLSLWRRDDA